MDMMSTMSDSEEKTVEIDTRDIWYPLQLAEVGGRLVLLDESQRLEPVKWPVTYSQATNADSEAVTTDIELADVATDDEIEEWRETVDEKWSEDFDDMLTQLEIDALLDQI